MMRQSLLTSYFKKPTNLAEIKYTDTYNMEDYTICIPSYKRAVICNRKTLKTLNDIGISKDKIKVFIVEEEQEAYATELNPEWYGSLVVGVKGLVPQRQFITDYHPAGTHIISLDDDIEGLDLSLTAYQTADEFFKDAFKTCEKEKAFLWSVYPVFNEYFRKERKPVTTEISFAIGAFFGYINRPNDPELMTPLSPNGNKEDVERSIRYYLKDGKVVRFNRVGFKTKYYGTDGGGLGTFKSRLEKMKENAIALNEAFPDITRIKVRKNGMYEIVLRTAPPKRQKKAKTLTLPSLDDAISYEDIPIAVAVPIETTDEPVWLPPLAESETAKLYEMLSKIKVPKQSDGRGRSKTFGEHRSMTLGYIKGRVTRKYDLSYNSKRMPQIYEEVCRIGKLICPFEFSAIHLNHNVQCPRHIDGNNAGKSVIISLGEYEGGSLFIEGQGEFVTKNHPLIFDGGKYYHWNAPITSGNKYSLVFFSSSNK
jgi:hypothetical protein